MTQPLHLERIAFDSSGAPFSPRYGDVYASRDGALGQARHVFLAGNDLPARWAGRHQFVIVETGFGLGTNFLATWQAWREDPQRPRRLHVVSIEKHPLPASDLLSASPPELRDLAAELARRWPLPLPGLHAIEFEAGRVTLTLALGDARELVPQLVLGADAFYLDGFAPDRNPELWEPPLLKALVRLARPAATLATYTTAHAVRDALVAGGFEIDLRPGYGRKRQMLAARFAPRWKVRRHEPPPPCAGERRAIVVGAGLAGCASAYALARRGWTVTLVERAGGPAQAASALPAGLLHPLLSSDDNVAARLTRAGFLMMRRRLHDLLPDGGGAWNECGVFQQAADAGEAHAWQAMLRRWQWPDAYARWLDTRAAAVAIGLAPQRDGLWFEQGMWVAPPRWCRALIDAAGPGLETLYGTEVTRIACDRGDPGSPWEVDCRTAGGASLPARTAPVAIVANALGTSALAASFHLPIGPVRGRITLLAPGALSELRAGVSGDGYLVPPFGGQAAAGATYETPLPGQSDPFDVTGLDDRAAHDGNLARLRRLLEAPPAVEIGGVFDGARCVARDRLPLAGALADEAAVQSQAGRLRGAHLEDLPRRTGLFAVTALGTRGLALALLMAERVAAQIEGEPWPIERALAAAVDPARFLLRRLR